MMNKKDCIMRINNKRAVLRKINFVLPLIILLVIALVIFVSAIDNNSSGSNISNGFNINNESNIINSLAAGDTNLTNSSLNLINNENINQTNYSVDSFVNNENNSANSSFVSRIVDLVSQRIDYTTQAIYNLISAGVRFTNSFNVTGLPSNYTYLSINPVSPYNSLVGYWSFDADNSTTAFDLSNNVNDGTYTNYGGGVDSPNTTGVYGNGAYFDGVDDRVSVPFTQSLNFTNSGKMIVSVWVRFNGAVANLGQGIVADWGSAATSPPRTWVLVKSSTSDSRPDKVEFSINNTGSNSACVVTEANKYNTGVWINYIAGYNGTDCVLYKNGILDNSSTATVRFKHDTTALTIGSLRPEDSVYPFNGSIDDVMIFNSSLTQAQITAIYNNQSTRHYNTGVYYSPQITVTSPASNTLILTSNNYQANKGTAINVSLGTWDIGLGYNETSSPNSGDMNYGLVGYWHGDNVTGNANVVAGKVGNALSFNGINQYVNFATPYNLGTKDMTYCAWVNPYSANPNKQILYGSVTSIYGTGASTIQITYYTGGTSVVTSKTIPIGSWSHVCATRSNNGVNNVSSVYINGVANQTQNVSAFVDGTLSSISVSSGSWNGSIDQVRIWNRSLSSTEIANLYNNESAGLIDLNMNRTGLVGEWNFNESNTSLWASTTPDTSGNGNNGQEINMIGATVADSSGNGNNGNVTGGMTLLYRGKYNQSFNFNGVNGYVTTNSQALGVSTAMSVSTWVYINTIAKDERFLQKPFNSTLDGWNTFGLIKDSTGKIQWTVQNYTSAIISSYPTWLTSSAITTGWHHIVGTFNKNAISSADGAIYIDGIAVSTTYTANSYSSGFGISDLAQPIYMGIRPISLTSPFNGSIDEVMIYNRSLSAQEVYDLYARGRANWQYTSEQAIGQTNTFTGISSNTTNVLPVGKLISDQNNSFTPYLSFGSIGGVGGVLSDFLGAYCDLIDPVNGTCYINHTYYAANNEYINNGINWTNIVIQNGGSISNISTNIANHGASIVINITGNLTILSGGNITAGNITINAQSVNITLGGIISANGLGYLFGKGPGAGIAGLSWNYAAGGGSYGGIGGANGQYLRSSSYGSYTSPIDFGSGGGDCSSTATSGGGGGIVKINATQIIVTGNITSNGNAVNGNDGGCIGSNYGASSGGSIWLISSNISGNGVISANGINGGDYAGGGSGGRIAVYYTLNSFTGNISAYGGAVLKRENGAAGTVYLKANSQNYGDLIIDNNGVIAGGARVLLGAQLSSGISTFDNITIRNKGELDIQNGSIELNLSSTNVIGDGNFYSRIAVSGNVTITNNYNISNWTLALNNGSVINNLQNITIGVGGILTHSKNYNSKSYYLDLSLTKLEILAGGTVNVDGLGYGIGQGPGAGSYGACWNYAAGGGSYGGIGGLNGQSVRNSSYGTYLSPIDFGSGAGDNSGVGTYGGGGGIVKINATQIIVTGNITSNGAIGGIESGNSGCTNGAGSGGSIWLISNNISGNGTIYANGANGGGGSGGGGRIHFQVKDFLFNGNLSTAGGTTGSVGTSGSIVIEFKDSINISSATFSSPFIIARNSSYGRLYFNQSSVLQNGNKTSDFVSAINISNNFVYINSTAYPSLNQSATVVFSSNYSGIIQARVYRDGVLCSGCGINYLRSGEVSFNVSGFSNYSVDVNTPGISFVGITPSNYLNQSQTSVYLNVSSSDIGPHSVIVDWNRSLVGWWRFNNESGENTTFFKDYSSWGNNGTCSSTSCPNFTQSGYLGGAYQFDGVGSYVSLGLSNQLNFTRNYTLSAWVKPGIAYRGAIIKQGLDSIADGNQQYYLYLSNPNTLALWISNGTKQVITSTRQVSLNNWSFVSAIVNDTSVSLYINGILDSTTTISIGPQNIASTVQLIGAAKTTISDIFNGSMDDVQIYNRALSQSEISALYNASANQYYNNFTGLTNGAYTFNAYAQDLAGLVNTTGTRIVTVDSTLPNGTLLYPLNGTTSLYNSNQNFTVNVSDNYGLTNATLNILNSTNNIINQTTVSLNGALTSTIGIVVSLVDGFYKWFYNIIDVAGNQFNTENRTILIDTHEPNTTSEYPSSSVSYQHLINSINSPYDSLVGYWNFDQDNSTTAFDLTGNNNDGTINSNLLLSPTCGMFGAGICSTLTFPQRISIPYSASLNSSMKNGGKITISAWTKIGTQGSTINYILTGGGATTGATYMPQLAIWSSGNGGKLYFGINVTGGTGYPIHSANSSGNLVNTNTWMFVTGVFNGTDNLLYINGVLNGTCSETLTSQTTNSAWYIGDGGGGSTFNGSIDDIMVFNSSLTQAQITAIYNNQSQRFYKTGQSYLSQFNVTSGYNNVQLLLDDFARDQSTNITESVGAWDISRGYNDTASADPNNINYGLVGYWHGDNVTGNANVVAGKVGNALQFDGVDDYVQSNNNVGVGGSEVTVMAWFKIGNFPATGFSWKNIAGEITGVQRYGIRANRVTDTTGKLASQYYNASSVSCATPVGATTVNANTWYQGAFTYSLINNQTALYLNGVNDTAYTGTSSCGVLLAGGVFTIGGAQYINATIDQVRIWNRSLSATEIANLYNNESAGLNDPNMNRTGLFGEWNMNESAASLWASTTPDTSGNNNNGVEINMIGANVSDSSGNGNNGNAIGGTTLLYGGEYNQSFSFNGVNGYVNTTASLSNQLDGLSQMSISVWIYPTSTTTNRNIVTKYSTGTRTSFVLGASNGNNYLTLIAPTTTDGATTNYGYFAGSNVPQNKWSHLTAVFDGTQATNPTRLKMYLNGNLMALTFTGSIPSNLTTTSVTPMIGAGMGTNYVPNSFWNGSIDEVMIYNRSLSGQEVYDLYARGRANWNYTNEQVVNENNRTYNYSASSGIVSCWIDGTTDSCGGGNNGNLIGGASWANSNRGTLGNVTLSTTTSQYMNITTNNGLLLNNSGTISFWSKKTIPGPSVFSDYVSRGVGAGVNQFSVAILTTSGNQVQLRICNGSATGSIATILPSGVPDDKWHYFAGTWNGTMLVGYYDGVVSGTPVAPTVSIDMVSNYPWSVGAFANGGNYNFGGYIDEVAIWNRSLSASEIRDIYLNTKQNRGNNTFAVSTATTNVLPRMGLSSDSNGFYTPWVKSTSFTSLLSLDTQAPTATLTNPANNTLVSIDQNFTVNASDNAGLANATLNIINSTGSVVNQTTVGFGGLLQSTIGIVVSLVDGVYKWFYSIIDIFGNVANTQNNTIIINCDQGDHLTNCNITSVHNVLNGSVLNYNNLNILNGGALINTANLAGFVLNLSGNLNIYSGGNITAGNITIYAQNVTINSGGKIVADSIGYVAGNGSGAGSGSNSGGGGGYGGRGGSASSGALGGIAYGSSLNPVDFGSGGATSAGCLYLGGSGGGVVKINVANTFNLNGTISTNGGSGVSGGCNGGEGAGGGGGGSINILTGTLSGIGNLSANGGSGGSGGAQYAGGGSGGRIVVYYNQSTINFTASTVNGGTSSAGSSYYGSEGTLLFIQNSTVGNNVYVRGGFTTVTSDINTTFYNTANPILWNFTNNNLTLDNVNQLINLSQSFIFGSNLTQIGKFRFVNNYANMMYLSISAVNFILDANSGITYGNITIGAANLTVSSGASLNGNSLGYGSAAGTGAGSSSNSGGGGGYGGRGGASSSGATGGIAYGSLFSPIDFGSGGGNSAGCYSGGSGGGVVKINVTNTFNLNGTIVVNGASGTGGGCNGGGGSGGGGGGSINILTGTLSGIGNLSANGGSGGSGGAQYAGGGSGGRIVVYYQGSTFMGVGNSTILGGSASGSGVNGSNGTIVYWDLVKPNVQFIGSTLPTKSYVNVNSYYVNMSSSEQYGDHYSFVDWNRSLAGWWRMEQGNGTFFADSSSYGNNGTCIGTSCPNVTIGKFGAGYQFDGVGNYVNLSDISENTSGAVSMWINPAKTINASSNTNSGIFVDGDTASTYGFMRWYYSTTGSALDFEWLNSAQNAWITTTTATRQWNASTWYYILGTWNSTGQWIYVNGILENYTSSTGIYTNIHKPWLIGAGAYGASYLYFNGSIDNAMIFNRALSQSEISALYNASANQYYNNFTNLAQGVYNYTGYAEDYAGNVNSTDTRTITVDLTLPNGTLLSPGNNTYTNIISNNFSANLSDNYGLNNATLNILNSTNNIVNQTTVLLNGALTSTIGIVVSLVDGFYKWFYNIIDLAGNQFNTANNNTLTIDTTNPLISYGDGTLADYSNVSQNLIYVNVSVSEINEANITFRLYNLSGTVNSTVFTNAQRTINWTNLADGVYYYNVTDVDLASNLNSTVARTITLDKTKPLISYTSPTQNSGGYLNRNYIEINVSASDTNLANVTFNLYNVTSFVNSTLFVSSPFYVNYSSLAEGIYFYNATVIDYASNLNNTITRNITLDRTNPLISYGSGTLSDYTNVSQNLIYVNVSVSEINFANITYSLYNLTGIVNSTVYSSLINTIIWNNLPDNHYMYNVTIYDLAGNVNYTQIRRITLDVNAPNGTLLLPANGTYLNYTNVNLTANVSDAMSGINNATLNIYNQTGLYNQTTVLLNGALQSTIGIVVNLVDGVYSWFYNLFDFAGNQFNTVNNTVITDTTNPTINFSYPTPADESYNPNNNISINVTGIEVNRDRAMVYLDGIGNYMGCSGIPNYECNYTFFGLLDGWYNVSVFVNDSAGNYNNTETRAFAVDTTSPTISSVWYYPNTNDSIDPGTNISFYANVSDDLSGVNNVYLEVYNGTDWKNISMARVDGDANDGSYEGNITTVLSEENYTFNIWANDNVGNVNFTINRTFKSYWDCTWNIITAEAGNSLGTTGGFFETRSLGNVTIVNSGDREYSINNCSIRFAKTLSGGSWSSYANFSVDYVTGDFPGRLNGLRYYHNGNTVGNLTVMASTNQTLEIKGIFPRSASVYSEYPFFPVFSSIADSLDGRTNETIFAKMIVTPGAYLEVGIDSNVNQYITKLDSFRSSNTIYLTPGNVTFNASIKDVVDSSVNINNTAYNVYHEITFDNLTSGLIVGETNASYSELNDTSKKYVSATMQLTASNIVNLGTEAFNVQSEGYGYENSTGNLSLIKFLGNQTATSATGTFTFACYPYSDGVCVSACINLTTNLKYDPDCDLPGNNIVVNGNNGNSGGGGGGGGGAEFKKSELLFQIIRGKQNEIKIPFKNANPNLTLSNVKFDLSGRIARYIEVVPKEMDAIAPSGEVDVLLKISSPSYLPLGKESLVLTIKGKLGEQEYTEQKNIVLEIVELNRSDALALLDKSSELIKQLKDAGLKTEKAEQLLNDSQAAYNNLNFGKISDNYNIISKEVSDGLNANKILKELDSLLVVAKEKGINTANTERLVKLAKLSLDREEYDQAYSRAKEAQVSYALEVKGEFGKLSYYIKENPVPISLGILFITLFSFASYKIGRFEYLKNKVAKLKEEEAILNQLIKVIQTDTFITKKMGMEEYQQALSQYEKKMATVIEELIDITSLKTHTLRLTSNENRLKIEKRDLIEMIKQLQKEYLTDGKIEAKVYELKLQSYMRRLGEIDQETATREAQREMNKKGRWSTLINFIKESRTEGKINA